MRSLFILASLLFWALVSHAATCTQYKVNHGNVTEWSSSAAAACSVFVAYLSAHPAPRTTYSLASQTATSCRVKAVDEWYPDSPSYEQGGIVTREGNCQDTVCKSKQGQDFTLNWSLG